MRTRLLGLTVALISTVVFGGCGTYIGDWTMFVHNGTDQMWYVRVDTGDPTYPEGKFVAHVDPGADGPSVDWKGAREATVEVLGPDCATMGVLRTLDGTTYVVDGIPGFSGHIDGFSLFRSRSPGIYSTDDCGGIVFL